jgi:membrane protein YqaA with SNARE-associated domain
MLLAGGSPWACFAWATSGNWLGSLTCYGLGYLGKWEWIEKWLKVKKEKLDKQKAVIDKWGSLIALVCWLPVVGDIFAVGLGFYRVHFAKSAFFMLVGKALRFLFWITLWYLLPEKLL